MVETPLGPRAEQGTIVVVGSLNRDVVFDVDELPKPGETVSATSRSEHWGGKGANQAVAAARLGGSVSMIGAVGNDVVGTAYLSELEAQAVSAEAVRRVNSPTGEAFIAVERSGENSIVIDPGANGLLTDEHVGSEHARLAAAAVVLLQFEVPLSVVSTAAGLAGGLVIVNPAPFQPLPERLLADADIVVPNEVELSGLTGIDPGSPLSDLEDAARSLGTAVIVTLGERGSLVLASHEADAVHVEPLDVDVVDTTAAGDAFCAAIAVRLAEGASLVEAATFANAAGAATVMSPGAQSALPDRQTVETLLS